MTKVETDALCSLCGLDCGIRPLHDQVDGATLPFCCSGCLNVHAILRASGVLKSGSGPDLDARSAEIGGSPRGFP